MNNYKNLYRAFGFLSLIITLIVYAMTVQPSVPFWDCGEFSAATTWQQVPHPPGAPLFLMVGKFFQLILPFSDPGLPVNLLSVTATAFSVFFLYFVTVKVILNFYKSPIESVGEAVMIYGSALVGALAFCFSDTLWFNGVESEVYASSTFFTSLVVYLMMRWNDEADKPGHERYLLLMAYLIGLSTGVHLLAILTSFSIVMLVYFRKYKVTPKSFIIMGIIGLVIFAGIYKFVIMWLPTLLAGDFPFRNEAREYLISQSPIMTLLAILIIIGAAVGLYWGIKNKKPIVNLVCSSFLLMLLGFTTYTQVLIRSNANPPMNENEPNNMRKLISYLGREQYGDAGNWPRRTDANDELKMMMYNKKDDNGDYVYGEWLPPDTKRVRKKDGTETGVPDFNNLNLSGELNYLFKYQIDHMYFRYLFWNFVGKQSDMQDAEAAWFDNGDSDILNYKSGYASRFPVKFFAIPFLFGLIGLYTHFKRDWKMGLTYFTLFLLTGVLAAIAQNQQEPQPRERDYFYVGSFFVYCMWIGMGTWQIIDWSVNNKKKLVPIALVLLVSMAVVPLQMAVKEWGIHTRAGNYIPFDYSYNILQSTEKDAILFTNGDNDTFPLWYLQDVLGIRRDVRVVNLSLGQTLWYVDQLKNREPWGAKKIPLSFSNESLEVDENDDRALSPDVGEAKNIAIPVSQDILRKYTNDPEILKDGNMRFTYVGRPYTERDGKKIYLFLVNNKLVLDILQTTKFERPVYFSSTVGPDVYSGLGRHLRYEGMALRVCPIPANQTITGTMDPNVMDKCLLHYDNSDNYQTGPAYGFKFRNLNNMNVYYDEVHRRLMGNYRLLYSQYAAYSLEKLRDSAKCIALLNTLEKNVSTVQFPLQYDEETQIALILNEAGAKEQAKKYAQLAVNDCNTLFSNNKLRRGRGDRMYDEIKGSHGTYKCAAESYQILGQYDEARKVLLQLYEMVKQTLQTQQSQIPPSDAQAIQKNMYDILGNVVALDNTQLTEMSNAGKKQEAISKGNSLINQYNQSADQLEKSLTNYVQDRLNKIQGKPGILDSAAR